MSSVILSSCHLVILSRIIRRNPAAAAGRSFDGIEHSLTAQAILKIGVRRFAYGDAAEQIEYAMCEGMLPADDMAGRPPGAHVLVRPIGHQHIAEALDLGRIVVEEHV